MKRLEVSGAVRPIYGSLGVKRLINANYKKFKIKAILKHFKDQQSIVLSPVTECSCEQNGLTAPLVYFS